MIAWFFAPYKRRAGTDVVRYCAIDDFTPQIVADGGAWSECECLGDYAVVKARASVATLSAIDAAPGILHVPNHVNLSDSLSDLTLAQKNAIHTRLNALGYTDPEIVAALSADIGAHTLGDLLRFVLRRRLQARYDVGTDTIVLDGPVQPTRPVEQADMAVA